MSTVVLDDHRTNDLAVLPDLDQSEKLSSLEEGHDPVIAAARAAGRLAGERLVTTPLTPRQCAVVASVMGGGARCAPIPPRSITSPDSAGDRVIPPSLTLRPVSTTSACSAPCWRRLSRSPSPKPAPRA